jgi:integrase
MIKAELLGNHQHQTVNGFSVHVWQRDGKFILRGSFQGQRYGLTVGSDQLTAAHQLRKLLNDLEEGRFTRPSESASDKKSSAMVSQRLTLLDLTTRFLGHIRKLRGRDTEKSYRGRLIPVLKFSEEVKQQYPFVIKFDAEWALKLKAWLHQQHVDRRGINSAAPKHFSAKHIRNVLETTRYLFKYCQSIDRRWLPLSWQNPITVELIGPKVCKDPLRSNPIPIEQRVQLINVATTDELRALLLSILLPLRPEQVTGLLVSDVDFDQKFLKFGTRLNGADFTKGRTSFSVPFPPEIESWLLQQINGRQSGPLLLKPSHTIKQRLAAQLNVSTDYDWHVYQAQLPLAELQSDNDRKRYFRRFLKDCGGYSTDDLYKSFKSLAKRAGLEKLTISQLRHAITTSMKDAGVPHLELRYLTGHTTSDIINHYTGLNPRHEMQKYFWSMEPLLNLLVERCNLTSQSS